MKYFLCSRLAWRNALLILLLFYYAVYKNNIVVDNVVKYYNLFSPILWI